MSNYTVTSTHELSAEELKRAPKGLKRSSITVHCSSKQEAIAEFEYREQFLFWLGFSDSLELRSGNKVLRTNKGGLRR